MNNSFGRRPSTRRNGGSFSEAEKLAVWKKGRIDFELDPTGVAFRRDACGAPMRYSEYGNTRSRLGWEIDHIRPVSRGGSDLLFNLQPLQWQNNRTKGDSLILICKIRA